jgi:hypothetical protein
MATLNYDSVKLGFKDSPGSGDDFIDLMVTQFNPANPANYVGYVIDQGGFAMGPVEDNAKWGKVRTLAITVQIEGSSKDDAIARLRTLNRFIQRSSFFFQDNGDNVSSRGDGKWHDGEAAVLTYQPRNASYAVYWDVIRGEPANMPDMITLQDKTLPGITFSLLVRAAGRLTRVRLNNLVAMGDAAPPFMVVSPGGYAGETAAFNCGWTFTGTWNIVESTANGQAPKYGFRTLVSSATGSTFTTNGGEVSQNNGDVVVPELWIALGTAAPTGGTLTVKMQTWNGSVWADQQTLVSLSSFGGLTSPSFTAPNWIRYTGTVYTVGSGISQVRLTGTLPTLLGSTAGQVAFDGFANWKNLINNTVPTTEYATGGKTMGIPAFNVYGLRGDVKTPIKMRIDNTGSQIERFFVVSGMTQDLGTPSNRVEYPLFGLDLAGQEQTTAAPQLPWGTLPGDQSGSGTTTTLSLSNYINRTLDRHPRLYRAFLVYAANDAISISAVKLGVAMGSSSNLETKTFNVALPNTYTGNTVPTASQHAIYELGDFLYSRPGVGWEDNINGLYIGTFVTLTHTSSVNRHISVAGVILMPLKVGSMVAATLDIGSAGLANFPLAVEIYNEGKAPRGAIQPAPNSGSIPIEMSSYDSTGILKGGTLWVLPAEASTPTMAMRFEVLMFRSRNDTTKLYTFDARDTKQVSIEYTPRYLYGMAS